MPCLVVLVVLVSVLMMFFCDAANSPTARDFVGIPWPLLLPKTPTLVKSLQPSWRRVFKWRQGARVAISAGSHRSNPAIHSPDVFISLGIAAAAVKMQPLKPN